MKHDISNRTDIELLLNTFYSKAKVDPVIGHIFTTVFTIDWEKHLPVIYDFWENVLFGTGGYSGNPMASHKAMNKIYPFTAEHFKRWVKLFTETIDELFEGEKAILAQQRAMSIATIMQVKILEG